jgi:predicted lipoprotein with Yx(FWY)xxD motif
MKLHSLMLGAAALLALSSPTFAADYLGGLVKSADIGGKMVLTDTNGMTLYTYDKDEKGVASNCYDKCADELAAGFCRRRHQGRG